MTTSTVSSGTATKRSATGPASEGAPSQRNDTALVGQHATTAQVSEVTTDPCAFFASAVSAGAEVGVATVLLSAMAAVSMSAFAAAYAREGADDVDLQVALYVQALRYHTSAKRRGGLPSLYDCVAVAERGAAAVRQAYYQRSVAGCRAVVVLLY